MAHGSGKAPDDSLTDTRAMSRALQPPCPPVVRLPWARRGWVVSLPLVLPPLVTHDENSDWSPKTRPRSGQAQGLWVLVFRFFSPSWKFSAPGVGRRWKCPMQARQAGWVWDPLSLSERQRRRGNREPAQAAEPGSQAPGAVLLPFEVVSEVTPSPPTRSLSLARAPARARRGQSHSCLLLVRLLPLAGWQAGSDSGRPVVRVVVSPPIPAWTCSVSAPASAFCRSCCWLVGSLLIRPPARPPARCSTEARGEGRRATAASSPAAQQPNSSSLAACSQSVSYWKPKLAWVLPLSFKTSNSCQLLPPLSFLSTAFFSSQLSCSFLFLLSLAVCANSSSQLSALALFFFDRGS